MEDLAWEFLGVDLEEPPLPRASAALPTIPRVMPDKPEGHNRRVCGVHKPSVPYYKALPPTYPPTNHLLPCLNARQAESTPSTSSSQFALLAASTSSHVSSNPVSLKAAPSTRTKIPLPSSTSVPSPAPATSSKDNAPASEDDAYIPKPAEVQEDGSRFQDSKPGPGCTLMGWQNPIMLWSSHL